MTQKQEWFATTLLSQGSANQSIVFMYFLRTALGFASSFTQDFMWSLSWNELSLLECSSPAWLSHLWGWLVPISRNIPNLKHMKIIWNESLQLKILLKSTRFAYNDRTPPIGKAGGGDRWGNSLRSIPSSILGWQFLIFIFCCCFFQI